jgi:outer membrane protein assembly factor BamA
MKRLLIVFGLSLVFVSLFAQEEKEKKKEGWTLGALPVVAFDSDLGLKYGGLVNFYNYGKPSTYPNYKQSIYMEISRTTKGSGINQLFFDSEHLFPNRKIRVTGDLSFLTEKALDFYGFNGNEVIYNPDFENDEHADYISRLYYRHAREMIRFTLDFQGRIKKGNNKYRWLAGYALFDNNISTIDVNRLNEGKDSVDMLPNVPTIYDEYVKYGLISADEADGGLNQYFKFGLVYDTRDIQANPSKGIWSELLFFSSPGWFGVSENAYTKLILTHRQYFTLLKDRLTFVYRLSYQGTIVGDAPFYMQPYMISSYSPSVITEGLGGAKSLRGIMRNRVVGDGFAYGNFEFRWKFLRTVVFNQNLYLALNPFVDAGMVVDEQEVNFDNISKTSDFYKEHFTNESEKMHFTYGCGFHIALNENFVLSLNYGIAADKADGDKGLYIGTNWLF